MTRSLARPSLGGFLLAGLLLTGCGGVSSNNPEPPELRVVNGIRGETLTVAIDGVPVRSGIPFGQGGPGEGSAFYRLETGIHALRIVTADGTVLLDQPAANFRMDEMNSLFVTGTKAAPTVVGATDYRNSVDFGRATLRIANAWTLGPGAFDLYATRPGDSITDRSPLAESVAPGATLGPYTVDGGQVRYRLCTPGTKTVIFDRTVSTQNGLNAVLITNDATASGGAEIVVVP